MLYVEHLELWLVYCKKAGSVSYPYLQAALTLSETISKKCLLHVLFGVKVTPHLPLTSDSVELGYSGPVLVGFGEQSPLSSPPLLL